MALDGSFMHISTFAVEKLGLSTTTLKTFILITNSKFKWGFSLKDGAGIYIYNINS